MEVKAGRTSAVDIATGPASKTSPKQPRIADVAREAGVSKTAVSFAFNSPDRLSAETAAHIRDVADDLGYRPRPVARAHAGRNTMAIGLLTPQALSAVLANPFYAGAAKRTIRRSKINRGGMALSPLRSRSASNSHS